MTLVDGFVSPMPCPRCGFVLSYESTRICDLHLDKWHAKRDEPCVNVRVELSVTLFFF